MSDEWTKVSRSVWKHTTGDRIMKYRMLLGSNQWDYLHYPAGESFEGGDYTRHDNLRAAKQKTVDRIQQ